MPDARAAGPFSRWERSVARRYLFAKRKNGGVALISIISFIRAPRRFQGLSVAV